MLIVTQGGKSAKVAAQPFGSEDALQRYISANPSAIPLDRGVGPGDLHVLGREFPTRCGPIDVLGTDLDGHPYIIETKLYKNPDKRLVIAQVIDYGAALWASEPSVDHIVERLRTDAGKRGTPDPVSALAAFLDGDEQAAIAHIARIRDSLAAGRFTAIILMDQLPERLRDLITFMNENSEFRVLAVELEYYRHGEIEIAYPRVFGSEARNTSKSNASSSSKVDSAQYLSSYGARLGTDSVAAWRLVSETILTLADVACDHLPGGSPRLYLRDTPFGNIMLFRIADNTPELRDLLNKSEDLFNASAELLEAKKHFREQLLARVPGAYVGGSIGRVFVPLPAAAKNAEAIVEIIAQLNSALRKAIVAAPAAAGA